MEDIIDEQLIETMRKLTNCRRLLGIEKETNASLVELLHVVATRLGEIGSIIDARLNQMAVPDRLALGDGNEK